MENVQYVIGADLSKKTIDLFAHAQNFHWRIANDAAGFDQIPAFLQSHQINKADVLIVMEHTGLYSFCLEAFLQAHQIRFCKVNALLIKRSGEFSRGKSDKIDARRIAAYGNAHKQTLRAQTVQDKQLQQLQLLYGTRERLVRQKAGLLNAIKEYANIGLNTDSMVMQTQIELIRCFEEQIRKLETEMHTIIAESADLQQNYTLLQSIKGVGKILALATIIKTKNFTCFTNARKFACFCGTAPFEHTSGTSIKGRTRVSHIADKKMKTLLDLAAKTAIQHDKELKAYFLQRVENGKSKMSTINVIRNKIIYRMFAVVNRKSPFKEDFLQVA